jgi:hypothetical protein
MVGVGVDQVEVTGSSSAADVEAIAREANQSLIPISGKEGVVGSINGEAGGAG